ncbi:MAG: hypothetical protein AAFQ90_13335 [Pseudomonadota bacterium]
MPKTIRPALSALAAIGIAAAPAAAHAKTRASESKVYTAGANGSTSAARSAPGRGKAAKGEKLNGNAGFFAGFMVGLWTSGVIAIIANTDDDGGRQSPGT